jgi:hypothetical protein
VGQHGAAQVSSLNNAHHLFRPDAFLLLLFRASDVATIRVSKASMSDTRSLHVERPHVAGMGTLGSIFTTCDRVQVWVLPSLNVPSLEGVVARCFELRFGGMAPMPIDFDTGLQDDEDGYYVAMDGVVLLDVHFASATDVPVAETPEEVQTLLEDMLSEMRSHLASS